MVDDPEWTVEQVLNHRVIKRGSQSEIDNLIHGKGYGDEHNTGETSDHVPNFLDCVQDYWLTLTLTNSWLLQRSYSLCHARFLEPCSNLRVAQGFRHKR